MTPVYKHSLETTYERCCCRECYNFKMDFRTNNTEYNMNDIK